MDWDCKTIPKDIPRLLDHLHIHGHEALSGWRKHRRDSLCVLEDIRSYDAAKAGPQETLLFEEAVRQIQEDDKE
jgi:hypothetical protein